MGEAVGFSMVSAGIFTSLFIVLPIYIYIFILEGKKDNVVSGSS